MPPQARVGPRTLRWRLRSPHHSASRPLASRLSASTEVGGGSAAVAPERAGALAPRASHGTAAADDAAPEGVAA
eukprot:2971666-Lingulodinium_polyedra.AAC.1